MFQGQGSVTSGDGWTGYYDDMLHDGTDRAVLPMDTVNAGVFTLRIYHPFDT